MKEKNIFNCFLICVFLFLLIAPYFLVRQINDTNYNWLDSATPQSVIMELWEIDTFEGGSASRDNFLQKRAYEYQKLNTNVYILVKNYSPKQALNMLEQGIQPDMFSFGIGMGEYIRPMLATLDTDFKVRQSLLKGGIFNEMQLAIPWCMGGYVLCSQDETLSKDIDMSNFNIILGGEYNIPNLASKFDDKKLIWQDTQYQAYNTFLHSKDILLGTQRDFFRLNNKCRMGVLDNINYKYLGDYTDLVQYISIVKTKDQIVNEGIGFIKYLTSTPIQQKLNNIGMFGVSDITIYTNEYSDFEKTLQNELKVQNVFVDGIVANKLRGGGNE